MAGLKPGHDEPKLDAFGLSSGHDQGDQRHVQARAGAAQPGRGRHRGQCRAKPARRARTRPRQGADLVVFTELFLTGYPLEDLVLKPAFQEAAREALRGACARDRRRRSGHADGPALGRAARSSTTLWRCSIAGASRRCASRTICRITACSTRSACSRPGPHAAAGRVPRGEARRADLRGHLERGGVRGAGREPAPRC